jgi:hypothetical protein
VRVRSSWVMFCFFNAILNKKTSKLQYVRLELYNLTCKNSINNHYTKNVICYYLSPPPHPPKKSLAPPPNMLNICFECGRIFDSVSALSAHQGMKYEEAHGVINVVSCVHQFYLLQFIRRGSIHNFHYQCIMGVYNFVQWNFLLMQNETTTWLMLIAHRFWRIFHND